MKKFFALALLCLIGCSPSDTTAEKVAPSPIRVTDVSSALAAAKQQNKTLFLYFGASWCSPCKEMKAKVLSDPDVQKRLGDFIIWIADVDIEKDAARAYNVHEVPMYFLISPDGKVKASGSGGMSKQNFLTFLSK